jgi:hypothetical protein
MLCSSIIVLGETRDGGGGVADCSEFGNFVITLIHTHIAILRLIVLNYLIILEVFVLVIKNLHVLEELLLYM